jgi:gamma-glutamyltranspeptidase/glutathione hydrolase
MLTQGDAVDAAIAASFALGVLEPWMSGISGGGAMVLYRAAEQRFTRDRFGMRAPGALDPASFRLSGEGVSSDLFPWARVEDDRNVHGPLASPSQDGGWNACCPRAFRPAPWKALVEPAVGLRGGLLIDWFARHRQQRRTSTAMPPRSLSGRWLPPAPPWSARTEVRLPQQKLAQTLRRLADAGPRELYDGELAPAITREVREGGGALSAQDLASYRARAVEPLTIQYRGARIYATPELTAGPTLAYALRRLESRLDPLATPDRGAYIAYAECLQEAYAYRLARMGDVDGGCAPGCTSHFCVVDRQGNMAAVTQTLLSIFGSRFTLPDNGVLMNNGIMWFDPEPGKPNSLGPGKRCLTNYCPIIGEGHGMRFALGASGGRRILPAVMQLASFLVDYRKSLDQAFHLPRIDASEGDLVIGDALLDAESHAGLAARFPYVQARRQTLPFKFACPSGVLREGGTNWGATEICSPWADAVGET